MHLEPRMALQPLSGQLPLMNADVVADEVDGLDGSGRGLVDRFEESDRLQLTFASVKLRNDLARIRVRIAAI